MQHGDGKPDVRTVFIDHLFSPFGVALVGNALPLVMTNDQVFGVPPTVAERRHRGAPHA